MRERARLDALPDGGLLVDAPTDVCVRIAFAANQPARAVLVDARDGAERGPATVGSEGEVPARGAACVRRGETLRFVARAVDGGAALDGEDVRVIVRQSP